MPFARFVRLSRLGASGLLLLATTSLGCDDPGPAPTAAPSATAAPLASGTPVLAVAGVSFRAGEVVSEADEQVTVALAPPPGAASAGSAAAATVTVPRAQIWPREQATSAPGHGACSLELSEREGAPPAWLPCEITGGAGGKIRVRDAYGKRHTLDPNAVVALEGEAATAVADYLAREKRHREFDDAFLAAGKPLRPPKWDPAAGDAIVIHFVDTSWYGGEVVENKRDRQKLRVRFAGDTWDDRDLPYDQAAPAPTTTSSRALKKDGFALLRPAEPAGRWTHVAVRDMGPSGVTVEDRDGRRQTVKAEDLLPILPAG
ncbi:MAG: hypothetical protein R3B72_15675 [Polyangiaceae bacterium]